MGQSVSPVNWRKVPRSLVVGSAVGAATAGLATGVGHVIRERYKNMIHSYKDDESNSVDKVFESMESCVRRKGCKVIVIDNMMMLDLTCNEK